MAITLTDHGLAIEGKHIPVYSGSVHYWRLERPLWPRILDQVQALGFGMIETYIPWSIHETAPGVFDWGTQDARKDVEAFFQLCEARGLYLLARPGPLVNAELTDFGFPEWVLLDPEVQARTAVGSLHLDAAWGLHPPRHFPVPSYASPKFYEAVGRWFDEVCPLLVRHLAPDGCIVAVQSDNESCYLFHDQAYATDYSPSSLTAYRAFLQNRHETIDRLNTRYARSYRDFEAIEPPRDCEIRTAADVPWHRDWVEYKEYYLLRSVARIAEMLRARGVQGVPIFHDVAYQYSTPLDIARMEAGPHIDWVGLNLYRSPQQYVGTRQRMRYLAGTTRLPFVPELGSGIWSHHPRTPTPQEQEFTTLATLMYGMRAVNFYMLVERERWQGSPITRHGALRPEYADFYLRLAAFLRQYPLGECTRQTRVLVLLNYDLERYAAMASTLHYAHVDLLGLPDELSVVNLDLGFRWDVAREADHRRSDNWLGQALRALQQMQIDYDIADSHIAPQRLRRYSHVCIPTADFMDADDQQRLLTYVQEGGCLVCGPGVPYLDNDLRPREVLRAVLRTPGEAAYGFGHLVVAATDALSSTLRQHLPQPALTWDTPEVDVVEQVGPSQRLLFIANPTQYRQQVSLTFRMPRRLAPVWGSSSPAVYGDHLTLDLAPYTIHVWEARYV